MICTDYLSLTSLSSSHHPRSFFFSAGNMDTIQWTFFCGILGLLCVIFLSKAESKIPFGVRTGRVIGREKGKNSLVHTARFSFVFFFVPIHKKWIFLFRPTQENRRRQKKTGFFINTKIQEKSIAERGNYNIPRVWHQSRNGEVVQFIKSLPFRHSEQKARWSEFISFLVHVPPVWFMCNTFGAINQGFVDLSSRFSSQVHLTNLAG